MVNSLFLVDSEKSSCSLDLFFALCSMDLHHTDKDKCPSNVCYISYIYFCFVQDYISCIIRDYKVNMPKIVNMFLKFLSYLLILEQLSSDTFFLLLLLRHFLFFSLNFASFDKGIHRRFLLKLFFVIAAFRFSLHF